MRLRRLVNIAMGAALLWALTRSAPPTLASGPALAGCGEPRGQMVQIWVPSRVYNDLVPANMYLPPCYVSTTGVYPVIYLLHGGNSDETQWLDLGAQAASDTLIAEGEPPFIVIIPGGIYRDGIDYGAFVIGELVPTVDNHFHTRKMGAGRAIGGLSLGGYWAIRIALLHPGLFAAVGGNSPVVVHGDDDLKTLLSQTDPPPQWRMALDVGADDSLAYDTAQLARLAQARGLLAAFTVNPGGHTRDYWRAHMMDYLSYYAEAIASFSDRLCLMSRLPLRRC